MVVAAHRESGEGLSSVLERLENLISLLKIATPVHCATPSVFRRRFRWLYLQARGKASDKSESNISKGEGEFCVGGWLQRHPPVWTTEFLEASQALAEDDLGLSDIDTATKSPQITHLRELNEIFSESWATQSFATSTSGDTDIKSAVITTLTDLIARTECVGNCAQTQGNGAIEWNEKALRGVALALFASSVQLKVEYARDKQFLSVADASESAPKFSAHWIQREVSIAAAVLQAVCSVSFLVAVEFVTSIYQRGLDAAVILSVMFLAASRVGPEDTPAVSKVTSLTVFAHWLEAMLEPSLYAKDCSGDVFGSKLCLDGLSDIAQECINELRAIDVMRSPLGDVLLKRFFDSYRDQGEKKVFNVVFKYIVVLCKHLMGVCFHFQLWRAVAWSRML